MTTKTFVLASVALFAFGAGSAAAGPCTMEIDNLAKTIAAKDAGAGPTSGVAGGAQSTVRPSGQQQQHPPTALAGKETEGKAASPEDVRRQTAGQPTASEQGRSGAATGGDPGELSRKLEEARALDRQGKEAECMHAVSAAKQLTGPR